MVNMGDFDKSIQFKGLAEEHEQVTEGSYNTKPAQGQQSDVQTMEVLDNSVRDSYHSVNSDHGECFPTTGREMNIVKTKDVHDYPSRDLELMRETGSSCQNLNVEEEGCTCDSEYDLHKVEPPNGGWGWMCVLGCAMMHFFLGGFTRTYGVVYLQLIKKFGSSAAVTAWVGGVGVAIRMGGSPLGSGLANRFSARWVAFVGGLFLGLGSILSGLAPNTEYMFFSYSFIAGIGGTLMYSPGIVVVGQYFTTKRSIAIGLSTAGSGLGVFVMPLVLEWLYEAFGYFGGMLILGGLVFHTCLSGLLYRPLKLNRTKPGYRPTVCSSQSCKNAKTTIYKPLSEKSEKNSQVKECLLDNKNGPGIDSHEMHNTQQLEDTDGSVGITKKESCARNCWTTVIKYVDFTLLKEVDFVLFVVTLSLHTISYMSAQMLLPAHGKNIGHSPTKAALLLSVVGIADTIGRITTGFIFDMKLVRPKRLHLYNGAILISGFTCFAWAMTKSYEALLGVTVVHGLFNGAVVSQRAVMVSDLMGVEKLSSSFGLTVLGQGIALMVGPAIAGMLKDVTGTYYVSMVFCGASSTVAACTFLMISFRHCCFHKKKHDRVTV